jgi:hypothetical protein
MLPLSVRNEHEFLLHGMADSDLSELFYRMIWVLECDGQRVGKHGRGLLKDKPCFLRLAAALLEFHSKITLLQR